MFNWKGFENREFCVVFKNRADKMEFLRECEKRGYLWVCGEKPTQYKIAYEVAFCDKTISNSNGYLKSVIYEPHLIDCSLAENYIMERNRIRNENCGISNEIYAAELNGNSKLAIEIVQNWSDEHPVEPVVTRQNKFLEMYPKTPISNNGIIHIQPCWLGDKAEDCKMRYCQDCRKNYWNQPYKENNNE